MRKIKKQGLVLILVLSLLAMGMVGCGSKTDGDDTQKASETKFINIGTGGTAGTYYPLGGAIAEILKSNIPGVNATAESTGASVANINLLNAGNVDLAIVQNDVSYYANNGTELFEEQGKIEGLQAIASLYPETFQIVTLTKSGLKSVADFKGKKIAVGAIGSGVEANSRQVLTAYGLTYDDIKPQYLSFSEAASGLKDGNIDAAFLTAGFPTAAIQDISAQHEVTIIPVDDETADKLMKQYKFYTKVTIPAGTYAKQTEDVQSLAVKAMLVATDKMDEQTGYEITKAIFTNLDRVTAAHAVGKLITVENAKEGLSIPMHPGAAKFFDENK